MNILQKIWIAYTRPVYLKSTVLIIPMAWASVQISFKLWNFFFQYMTEDVYMFLLPVITVISDYGMTIGWLEVGIKTGYIIAMNKTAREATTLYNGLNTIVVKNKLK